MKRILIKNGTVIAPADGYHGETLDILIEDGVITRIEHGILADDVFVIDAKNLIVTPGFIDIHTHCFDTLTGLGVDADLIGIKRGTTAVLDAGSAGPENIELFVNDVIKKKKTKVYSLLNVSRKGLEELHELNSLDKISPEKIEEALERYGDYIVGFKARASSSVVGDLGIVPIEIAVNLAEKHNKRIMIHTGNFPPHLRDVLNLMRAGDVLTHAYHGKKGGILDESHGLIKEAINARQRGVLFDVGHGSASFSVRTFLRAKELGFNPDFVSTDLHIQNYSELVYSQHAVISKLINLGETLEDMIHRATAAPADHFGLKGIGHLKVGYYGDIVISELIDADKKVYDSMGDSIEIKKEFVPRKTIISKESSEIVENN